MFPLLLSFVAILALMTFGFNAVIERRNNPNQAIASGPQGPQRVVLARNGNRQYVVPGLINAQQVTFLIDTGADSVAIPAATAERLGLERGMAIQALTAAGPTVAYATHLERISIGGIELRDIDGVIIPAAGDTEILLGMSFLRHLDFQKKGDELILEAGS
tara:strand:+ start:202 stop:684 length:483 start_codon:yes stop_codon:yes gene_type:complete